MARLTRQQMKRDEVLETASRVFDFLNLHSRGLLVGIAAFVVLAIGTVGFLLYLDSQKDRANERLAEAIGVFEAEIVPEGAKPDDPVAPTFPSVESRDLRAEELFGQVGGTLGASEVGTVAGAYLGRLAARRGDLAAARENWSAFLASAPEHMLAAQVRMNLLALDRSEGRAEEVVSELRRMLAEGSGELPEVAVLDQLASALEDLGRVEEARDVYQQIVDDHSASAYAARARQKLGPA